jgi:glycosyltransferase involved in cell wall biosynthesis
MRILLVNSHGVDTAVGGAESYVLELSREVPRRGHEVEILRAFPGPEPEGTRVATLHASDWREDELLRARNHLRDALAPATRHLERRVRESRPDVVHTNNLPGISTGIWGACARLGVPVVHTLHDYQLLCPRVTLMRKDGRPCRPNPLLCGARSRSLGRHAPAVRHVIGVSRFILDRHAHLFSSALGSVLRSPFAPPPERRFEPPHGSLAAVGYLGTLHRHKGITELLAAAPALRRLGVRLRIAGTGPLEDEVRRAAATPGGPEFAGFVRGAAKEQFLESCEVGIVPSLWDEPGAPPWAALDWISAGRPVLLSPRGGHQEALAEGGALAAVEPTAEGIVEAVTRLRDGKDWGELVGRARATATAPSAADWLAAHCEIYEEVSRRG